MWTTRLCEATAYMHHHQACGMHIGCTAGPTVTVLIVSLQPSDVRSFTRSRAPLRIVYPRRVSLFTSSLSSFRTLPSMIVLNEVYSLSFRSSATRVVAAFLVMSDLFSSCDGGVSHGEADGTGTSMIYDLLFCCYNFMIFISRLSDTTAYFGPRVRVVFVPEKMQLKWPAMMMMLVGWGRVFMTIYDCDCSDYWRSCGHWWGEYQSRKPISWVRPRGSEFCWPSKLKCQGFDGSDWLSFGV